MNDTILYKYFKISSSAFHIGLSYGSMNDTILDALIVGGFCIVTCIVACWICYGRGWCPRGGGCEFGGGECDGGDGGDGGGGD